MSFARLPSAREITEPDLDYSKGGHANFFVSPQIRKFLGSFCNGKSANSRGVTVRKSQIRKLPTVTANINTVPYVLKHALRFPKTLQHLIKNRK
jgi:hypothetical protein